MCRGFGNLAASISSTMKSSTSPHYRPPLPLNFLISLLLPLQMGACFSKVFNGCPLRIHAAITWIHPVTRGRQGQGGGRRLGIPGLGPGNVADL